VFNPEDNTTLLRIVGRFEWTQLLNVKLLLLAGTSMEFESHSTVALPLSRKDAKNNTGHIKLQPVFLRTHEVVWEEKHAEGQTIFPNTHLAVSWAGDVEPQRILHYSYWTPGDSPAAGAAPTPFLHVCSQLGRPMSSAGCPASRSCFHWR